MRKRLMTGTVIVLVLGVVSLIAFNFGARSSVDPPVAANGSGSGTTGELAADVSEPPALPALNEPVVQESTMPEIEASIEAVMAGAATDIETETVSSNTGQPGGMNEGIKVHGRWTIEVTEPDGKLVSVTEFDNALVVEGQLALAEILGRKFSVGVWEIILVGTNNANGPCNNTIPSADGCRIHEYPPGHPSIAGKPNYFGDLSIDSPTSGPNAYSLVLSGSAVAANDTDIGRVWTINNGCTPSASPDDFMSCSPDSNAFRRVMTRKTLGDPGAGPERADDQRHCCTQLLLGRSKAHRYPEE